MSASPATMPAMPAVPGAPPPILVGGRVAVEHAETLRGWGAIPITDEHPSAALGTVGQGALRPALTAQITQHSGRHEQGMVLGIAQSLMSVAQITAPLLAGLLIDHRQLGAWALLAGAAAAVGLLFNLRQGVLPQR